MTMCVHDACEAWAEGRLSYAEAKRLTGAEDEADLVRIARECGLFDDDEDSSGAWLVARRGTIPRGTLLPLGEADVDDLFGRVLRDQARALRALSRR